MNKDINKVFKWITLIFSFFLITIGCVSIYESETILIGFFTILLATISLFLIIYILKKNPNYWILCVMLTNLLGICIGIISVINGVQHQAVGWFIGGLSTTIGIGSLILSLLGLFQLYEIKPFYSITKK